jgi:hypothetical protein
MTTKMWIILWALAVAAPAGGNLWAADPAASPPVAGKVLVLDNERTLEGDIDRIGEQYRVRRSTGETWLPAAKVLRLCATMDDAYAYLRTRANLRDPDERLRLAQWCHLNGLRQQAIDEVNAAVELRPEHAPSRKLLAHLQQTATASLPAAVTREAEPETAAAPPVDLNAEAMCAFSTKVQPILMNACAHCHAAGKGGAFKLMRAYDEAGSGRKTVQQNLAAVLAQLNAKSPQGSPLLTKALTAHGTMAQAPLKGKQAPPYRTLEEWVSKTMEANPQLRDASAPTPAAAAPLPAGETVSAKTEAPPPNTPATSPAPAKAEAPPTPPAAQKPEGPADPFDPMIFNRQMHPKK